jgi:hypothetical protein
VEAITQHAQLYKHNTIAIIVVDLNEDTYTQCVDDITTKISHIKGAGKM